MTKDITERKQAEEALRESEERYFMLFENSLDGIYRSTLDGRFIDVNPALVKMLGYESKEDLLLVDIPKDIYLSESDRPSKDKRNIVRVNQLKKKDGTLIWVESSSRGISDTKGDIIYEGIVRDITERKRAEEALRESEERYRLLFEDSIEGISLSKENRVVSANKALLDIFGYKSLEEFKKVTIFDHLAPEYREIAIERMKKRKKGEPVPAYNEYSIIRKDGKIRDIEVSTAEVVIENETHIQTTIRDITERKLAEEALIESEEKFRTLAEKSPNMIFINKQGKVVFANEKCEEIMGYTREEFYSPDFDFLSLIAPEHKGLIKENFRRHMKGEEVPPYEYTLATRKGERIDVIQTSKLIKYGGDTALLGIITDITERKKAEEELARKMKELERFTKLAVGRELKMVELKKRIKTLEEKLESGGVS